ncbi:MAG: CinA family protein [Epsilonproteobacteria bacterium]|nr:CinA family protein [Campylobacterota bacterium]
MKIKQITKKIIEILKVDNQTITFAESCTGGRVASAFTAISGASSVLNGSVVSYSNDIKSKWLGVKEKTLIDYGAVSSECVAEMLNGVSKMAEADYAIAISGIAGPTGGTEEKPVGTVYIGIKTPKEIIVKHYLFQGDRNSVQNQATISSIELLEKNL